MQPTSGHGGRPGITPELYLPHARCLYQKPKPHSDTTYFVSIEYPKNYCFCWDWQIPYLVDEFPENVYMQIIKAKGTQINGFIFI